MLFVNADAIGKGVGKALLNHAIHTMKVNKVDVNEQNEQAVGFYQHHGFKTVSRSELDGTGKPFPILHMELG
jgi:putative acetyltransferase